MLLLLSVAFQVKDWRTPRGKGGLSLEDSKTSSQIGMAFTGVRVDKLDQKNEQLAGGMSGYLLPFVIVSVHLLVVLVGAAYMARTKRRATATGAVG